MIQRISFAGLLACLVACMGDISVGGSSSTSDEDAGDVPSPRPDADPDDPPRPDADPDQPPPPDPVDADVDEPPPPDPIDADVDEPPPPDPIDAAPPVGGLDCTVAASWPAAWVALEDQVLVMVNQKRAAGATCGSQSYPPVGAVKMDAALRQAARCHGRDMGVLNYFSHDSQDGRSPWDRIDEAGYTANATGENIAAGYGTAQQVMDGWMTSEGHCKNIMNGGSNEIGVGYALTEGSDFGSYWVQTFGKRN